MIVVVHWCRGGPAEYRILLPSAVSINNAVYLGNLASFVSQRTQGVTCQDDGGGMTLWIVLQTGKGSKISLLPWWIWEFTRIPWWICLLCRRSWFDSWMGKIPWRRVRLPTPVFLGFPDGSDSKESACNAGDLDSIPGLGRSSGGGHGNPHQYFCLDSPRERRSLVGYSPRGCKESHMTEGLSTGQH